MAGAQVIPLRKHDPALEEEARVAASIVQGIREGNAAAEHALVERYSKGLRFLLLRRTRDESQADDLLHDTFCIALVKLRDLGIEYPERLAGWLRGTAIRVAMNAGRRRQREPHAVDSDAIARIPDREPGQFDHVAREQTVAAVHRLLESMPVRRDREILTRFFVEDQDKEEICRQLGLDGLHFNRVLFRARKRFRKLLEQSGHSAGLATGQDE